MQEFNVDCVVLKGYRLSVKAESKEDAIQKVKDMGTLQVAEEGSLKFIDLDYVEINE